MTPIVRRASGVAAIPTAALVVALLVAPGHAELEIHVWLLVTLGIALLATLAALRLEVPTRRSSFDQALRPVESAPARPVSLAKVERELTMAADTAFDVHHRLRGTLRPIAAGFLLARSGVDLDREPERARALLGDETWELLRPERPTPDDRTAPGIGLDAIERIVGSVERLRWS